MTDEEVKKDPWNALQHCSDKLTPEQLGIALAFCADKLSAEQLDYCVREFPRTAIRFCSKILTTKQKNIARREQNVR